MIASTLGGLPGPIDGPTLGAYGADLSKACGYANDHGMTGKITLDIRQTETINAAFSPSEIEIEEAHQMLDVPLDGPATAPTCRVTCVQRRSRNSPRFTACGARPTATSSAHPSKVLA